MGQISIFWPPLAHGLITRPPWVAVSASVWWASAFMPLAASWTGLWLCYRDWPSPILATGQGREKTNMGVGGGGHTHKLIDKDNGLLPEGTNSLPEPTLTYHQWGTMIFTWVEFHKRYLNHQSLRLSWNDLSKIPLKSPRGQWVNCTESSIWFALFYQLA